jgi:hypothetical protein
VRDSAQDAGARRRPRQERSALGAKTSGAQKMCICPFPDIDAACPVGLNEHSSLQSAEDVILSDGFFEIIGCESPTRRLLGAASLFCGSSGVAPLFFASPKFLASPNTSITQDNG